MIIVTLTINLHAPWVRSLKEKRAEVKSILTKVGKRFNVSVSEIDNQDVHQTITIGIAALAANGAQADSILDNVMNFIEMNTEATVTFIQRERR